MVTVFQNHSEQLPTQTDLGVLASERVGIIAASPESCFGKAPAAVLASPPFTREEAKKKKGASKKIPPGCERTGVRMSASKDQATSLLSLLKLPLQKKVIIVQCRAWCGEPRTNGNLTAGLQIGRGGGTRKKWTVREKKT